MLRCYDRQPIARNVNVGVFAGFLATTAAHRVSVLVYKNERAPETRQNSKTPEGRKKAGKTR